MSSPDRYTLHLSRQAERDIEHILQDTLEKYGAHQQRLYAAALDGALVTITDYPRIGHPRPDLSDRHLALAVREHVIVYRIDSPRVNVARVLHGRMDFTRHVRH